MEETSPREVLLKHGKWTSAKDFTKILAKKRDVSERQAKTLISKAYRNKEIKKHVFSDRTVIYGLAEFGPYDGRVDLVEDSSMSAASPGLIRFRPIVVWENVPARSSFALNSEVKPFVPIQGRWVPPPDFSFSPNYGEAHREKRSAMGADVGEMVQFPQVPFHWRNWSPYQLKVRLEVRVFLGGRNLGLIEDRKGYYNGEADILVEPYRGGLRDGCFTLPQSCFGSTEEITLEVRARILDQNDTSKNEYKIIKSWTYNPKEKNWFYEPKAFTEDLSSSNERMSSWESLKKALAEIGGHLTDIEVEKRRAGETFDKITVQGIMMLAGAKTMQAAAKIYVPDEYEGFLFTQASVNEADKLTWQGINYWVRRVEEIYDAYVVSFRIVKLVKPPLMVEPAWVFG